MLHVVKQNVASKHTGILIFLTRTILLSFHLFLFNLFLFHLFLCNILNLGRCNFALLLFYSLHNTNISLGYHWDCSDWVRRSQNPLPNITEVPGSEVPDSSSFHSNESNESRCHHLPPGNHNYAFYNYIHITYPYIYIKQCNYVHVLQLIRIKAAFMSIYIISLIYVQIFYFE